MLGFEFRVFMRFPLSYISLLSSIYRAGFASAAWPSLPLSARSKRRRDTKSWRPVPAGHKAPASKYEIHIASTSKQLDIVPFFRRSLTVQVRAH